MSLSAQPESSCLSQSALAGKSGSKRASSPSAGTKIQTMATRTGAARSWPARRSKRSPASGRTSPESVLDLALVHMQMAAPAGGEGPVLHSARRASFAGIEQAPPPAFAESRAADGSFTRRGRRRHGWLRDWRGARRLVPCEPAPAFMFARCRRWRRRGRLCLEGPCRAQAQGVLPPSLLLLPQRRSAQAHLRAVAYPRAAAPQLDLPLKSRAEARRQPAVAGRLAPRACSAVTRCAPSFR